MNTIDVPCPLCGSKGNATVLYPANCTASDFNRNVFSARRLPDRIHYRIVRCNTCMLVRSTPVMRTGVVNALYKSSHFTYQGETEHLAKTYIHALQPILDTVSFDDHLLEIGCGNGFLLHALEKRGYVNVFGVEPSHDAIHVADKRIKKNIIQSVMKPGLFPGATFRAIFLFQTLDHIANPNAMLTECFRLLVPGGYILAFNHNVDSVSSRLLGEKSPIIDIEHTHLYTPHTITALFQKHSFIPSRVYAPINIISLKHLVWLLPLPKWIKQPLLTIPIFATITVPLPLGNLCMIAQKPYYEI